MPDFTPSDFWMFTNMRHSICGTQQSRTALGTAIYQWGTQQWKCS